MNKQKLGNSVPEGYLVAFCQPDSRFPAAWNVFKIRRCYMPGTANWLARASTESDAIAIAERDATQIGDPFAPPQDQP